MNTIVYLVARDLLVQRRFDLLYKLAHMWRWAVEEAARQMGRVPPPMNTLGLPIVGLSPEAGELARLTERIERGDKSVMTAGGYDVRPEVKRRIKQMAKEAGSDETEAASYLIVLCARLGLDQTLENDLRARLMEAPKNRRYIAWVAVTGGGKNYEYTAWIGDQMRAFRQRNGLGRDTTLSADEQAAFTADLQTLARAATLMKKPWPRTLKGLRADPRFENFSTTLNDMDCAKSDGYDAYLIEGLNWAGEQRTIRECTLKDFRDKLNQVRVGFL